MGATGGGIQIKGVDLGGALSGPVMSATVYTDCAIVPTESTTWGSVKSIFR